MKRTQLRKVLYAWGEQAKVGQGKLLFFSEDTGLMPLASGEISKYDIIGEITYDFAYGIKKGFPGFAGGN